MLEAAEQPELPYISATELVSGHRDVMNLMEFPFFALQKTPDFEEKVYDDGKVRIEISPSRKGLATMWDKDVLIYAASLVAQRMNSGNKISRTVRFLAFDFFKSCQRSPGGRAYRDLEDTLARLQGTQIRTNIKLKDGWGSKSFDSWIKAGRMIERTSASGKVTSGLVEIELNDWVWRQIVDDKTILSINEAYFKLSSPLLRRFYELGRKHCGNQAAWTIALPRLYEKLGYMSEDRKGRARIKATLIDTIIADDLPEYRLYFAAMGDQSCTPLDPEEVRLARNAWQTTKLVFLRRKERTLSLSKLQTAGAIKAAKPKPAVPLEEVVELPDPMEVNALLERFSSNLRV